MSLATWLKFFLARHDAMQRIANTPSALWLAALFVLSAGFAREYDMQDLASRPWYLIVPLGASLATSFVLYCVVYLVSLRRSVESLAFWADYRRFLTLYWMTAPLAWLYAIPVERFLGAGGSTRANLLLLLTVAIWRVALIINAIMAIFGASRAAAILLVMLFADSLVLVVLNFTPIPIFNVMGGIPQSESEQAIQAAAFGVGAIAILTWIVWFLGSFVALAGPRDWIRNAEATTEQRRVSPALWILAVASLLIWIPVLPVTQPEQQLRHKTESALQGGKIKEGLDLMSQHKPSDYPPNWDPPPWLNYQNPQPPILDVLEVLLSHPSEPWARAAFVDKFERIIGGHQFATFTWTQFDPQEQDRYLDILEQLPEAAGIVASHRDAFDVLAEYEKDPTRQTRLRSLLGLKSEPPANAGER